VAQHGGKSLFRLLGEAVGHTLRAARTPVGRAQEPPSDARPREAAPGEAGSGGANAGTGAGPDQAREVRRSIEERVVELPSGKAVLRRTVIDEVVPTTDEGQTGSPRTPEP
jgi:hypothetical protein